MSPKISICIFLILSISCVKSQETKTVKKLVGGPCQGCEAVLEYGDKYLNNVDTLAGFKSGKEQLKLSGVIYQNDGKTPAKDVILYAYQTNEQGIYPKTNNSKGWEQRHGYIRGWIKTDKTGRYTLYTFRPASYPNTTIPQHIHLTIKEPDVNVYYIDDFYFEDDPNLTDKIRNRPNFRGGSGIIKPIKGQSLYEAKRDIILGLNIPDYN